MSAPELKWWWLSFADGPPPDGFLGAAIVQGLDFGEAIEEAWRRGINPGGEVLGGPLVTLPAKRWRNRLLSKKQATKLVDAGKVIVE